MPSNVANIAHLSGMLLGLILGFAFKKHYDKAHKDFREGIKLDENYMRNWEDHYLK